MIRKSQAESATLWPPDPKIANEALGRLMAAYLARIPPKCRDDAMRRLIRTAHDLVPIEIEEMIKDGMVGPEWREPKQ